MTIRSGNVVTIRSNFLPEVAFCLSGFLFALRFLLATFFVAVASKGDLTTTSITRHAPRTSACVLSCFAPVDQNTEHLQYATNELSQNECVLPSDMMPTCLTSKNETGMQNFIEQNGTEKHVSMVLRGNMVLRIY